MTWEGQTKAVQDMADALSELNRQWYEDEIGYAEYIEKGRQLTAQYDEEIRRYYEASRVYAEQRRINGEELSEEEQAFLDAYSAYQTTSGGMKRAVEG